jgi:hypothetical protein
MNIPIGTGGVGRILTVMGLLLLLMWYSPCIREVYWDWCRRNYTIPVATSCTGIILLLLNTKRTSQS